MIIFGHKKQTLGKSKDHVGDKRNAFGQWEMFLSAIPFYSGVLSVISFSKNNVKLCVFMVAVW